MAQTNDTETDARQYRLALLYSWGEEWTTLRPAQQMALLVDYSQMSDDQRAAMVSDIWRGNLAGYANTLLVGFVRDAAFNMGVRV